MAFVPDTMLESPETQTMTAVAKAVVNDDSTAILLGLLGFSATKLWNTAIWHSRDVWSSGCLAQPAVNRFAWRKTKPAVRAHKPGRGKQPCRIREQSWSRFPGSDSGIHGLQAGDDVKTSGSDGQVWMILNPRTFFHQF